MAPQSSDEPLENDEPALDTDAPAATEAVEVGNADRSIWEEARITPVEIALPAGVGFTLRAYRLSTTVTPTEIDDTDEDDLFESRTRVSAEDDEDEEIVILDEEYTIEIP